MLNWKSRLSVKYDAGDGDQPIIALESFQPTFAMNAERLDSVEAIGIGVVYMPPQLNFTITVKALGTAPAQLTMLALNGTPFQIVMEEFDEGDAEWALTEVLMEHCIITNAVPSAAAISGAPTATFSGFALRGTAKSASDAASAGAASLE